MKFHKHKHKRSPWITNGIIRSIKFRDNLYKQLKRTNQDVPEYDALKLNLKTYKKILDKNIRELKQNYYHRQFSQSIGDTKKKWDVIQSVLNLKKNKKEFLLFFKINGTKVTSKVEIAEHFNTFFTNIGPALAANINSPNLPQFSTYLTRILNHSFSFSMVSPNDISKIINNFKPKSSTGHDGLSMKLLKRISSIICDPLTLIINQSLNTGIFPEKLKIAKVLPIFKKDDEFLLNNYRPISLLPALSKILEKVVFQQLYSFFDSLNLFYSSQHGFKTLHSTETAALEFIDRTFKLLDSGKLPVTVYLDLSKAFDTLNHGILIGKLKYYGVTGTTLNWFKSYLHGRSQYVQINDVCSKTLPLQTGVPQGSILGPLLFIIYINDLMVASPKFEYILYADDSTLINSLCVFRSDDTDNNGNTADCINQELKKVHDWLSANKLSLNVSKTKFMIFHFPQRKLNVQIDLQIANTPIEKVNTFDFLGLTVNENLNWNNHICKISTKLSKIIGILKRLHNVLPRRQLLLIYNTLFLPHINYCILAWGFSSDRIFLLQKRAIRLISSANFLSHTEPLFKELNTLKVTDIQRVRALKFYFRYVHNELPHYFTNIFATEPLIHPYTTRYRDAPRPPIPVRSTTKNSIRFYIPGLLTDTPSCIKDKFYTHSYDGFSKYVKDFFLRQYSEICLIENCYACNN